MKRNKLLKVCVLALAIGCFSVGLDPITTNEVSAQSLAGEGQYSPDDRFCVKAKVKLGLGLKDGKADPGISLELTGGRKTKCIAGLESSCSETKCVD
ncbi:hypothetical protein [Algoriphagus namhaensis]